MPVEKNELEKIALGSGKLYCVEFEGMGSALPVDDTIETDANLLGLIKGGASIEYSTETYETQDDLGLAKRMIITKEEAVLKAGIITWNGNTLTRIASTARVTEDTENKKRTVKIGGITNDNGKRWLLRFVHLDPTYGNVRVTIAGTNRAGLSITYQKDQETVLNPEFLAQPLDSEGTLIIFEEPLKEEGSSNA